MFSGQGINTNVTQRRRYLAENRATIDRVYSFDKMPDIVPIDNQIQFYADGIEAVVGRTPAPTEGSQTRELYRCELIDEPRKQVIKFSYFGENFLPEHPEDK